MTDKEKTRKTYRKPRIQQVSLVPEEAVLQGCKTAPGDPAQVNRHCNHALCQRLGS